MYTAEHLSCGQRLHFLLNGSSKAKKPFTLIETLFMLASLKLSSRKLSEHEEEIKLLEGHLKWLEFKAFIPKLLYLHLFSFSLAYKNHLHTKCNFFFPRLSQIPWEPGYGCASNSLLLSNMGWGLRIKNFNIMGVHWKINFLGRVHRKTNVQRGDCPKKEGLGQFSDLRGAFGKKQGLVCWRGRGLIPQCRLWQNGIFFHQLMQHSSFRFKCLIFWWLKVSLVQAIHLPFTNNSGTVRLKEPSQIISKAYSWVQILCSMFLIIWNNHIRGHHQYCEDAKSLIGLLYSLMPINLVILPKILVIILSFLLAFYLVDWHGSHI